MLDSELAPAVWPDGFALKRFSPDDAAELHALLTSVFDDEEPDFARWWVMRSGDPDYDPDLIFPLRDGRGRLAAAALCWKSAYVKDLAVAPFARREGLAEALMRHALVVFRERGAQYVDLKTNLVSNAAAVRLYRKLGMYEVDWAG